jgi:hypothetical protein
MLGHRMLYLLLGIMGVAVVATEDATACFGRRRNRCACCYHGRAPGMAVRMPVGDCNAYMGQRVPDQGSVETQTFTVQGMTEGFKRNASHGFYTIDVREENPPDFWEAYRWTRHLYYKGKFLDEGDSPSVSPSGRFVVYESTAHGGLVLFDTISSGFYRVVELGTVPSVEEWSPSEEAFRIRYYPSGNESRTILINVRDLKPIEARKAEPPTPPARKAAARP